MQLNLKDDFDKINEAIKNVSRYSKIKMYNGLLYDDFYQEAWAATLRYLDKHNSIEEIGISAKLYRWVVDAARKWSHSRYQHGQLFVDVPDEEIKGSIKTNNSMAKQDVGSLILAYVKDKQAILVMHYLDGLTLKEISTKIGVTEGRVCQIVGDFKRLSTRRLKKDIEVYNGN